MSKVDNLYDNAKKKVAAHIVEWGFQEDCGLQLFSRSDHVSARALQGMLIISNAEVRVNEIKHDCGFFSDAQYEAERQVLNMLRQSIYNSYSFFGFRKGE